MFKKILIANRGEIAVRIVNACRELAVKTVAVHSDVDGQAKHVQISDEAYELKGHPGKAYLDIDQIVSIAQSSGAEAIHPGYGFLSENSDFALACKKSGIAFIGPEPEIIRQMGSKVESRAAMVKAGVPVVPGTLEPVASQEAVADFATSYGYPVAIKASAGGGGRGLRVVQRADDIEKALSGAQREGASYFGSDVVYLEKYLDRPKHVEVQILADQYGTVVHLGERNCSTQRRHQKLVEYSPASELPDGLRQKMCQAAVAGAKSIGYTSAGTMEFLVSGGEFYFLEMNTRVQVEHPVTELVTGIDIVKEQIAIAAGRKLPFDQSQVTWKGFAIECRINAEDPFKSFMPSPGTITRYVEPDLPAVRIDSACHAGYKVLPYYDSLLAKLVVWGSTRQEAIERTRAALKHFIIEGVATTIPFHLVLMDEPSFQNGELHTLFVETEMRSRLLKAPAIVASESVRA